MVTLTLLYVSLGCVSAENLEDTNTTIVSIDDNSQLNEINFDYTDLESSNIEEESNLQNPGDYVQIKDHKTGKTGTITTSDSSVSLDMTWSGAGGTTLYLYVDGQQTSNTYTVSLFENYGSADSVFTYNFPKEGTYVLKVDTGSHIYESNHITYIYTNGGSQTNGTEPSEDSASISIYDMAYPGQSTIVTEGDYVSDIAYTITKSGDGFTNENLDVIVNGQKIGSTTPKPSNRLGNLTFTEDNEWILTIIYTATVNGKTVTATSNNLTFITRNTSGGNSSGNGTEDENGSATITIYDISYPNLSTITSDGDYTAKIAYNIAKSGDGFSDENLDVIVNGRSIGLTTPNSSNRLGNIIINEDNEWIVYVIYTATVNGKTVTAVSNNLTFITRNTSGGNSSVNETGNNTNESGETPEPQPGEMQVIIRDANYPNNAVITLNDKYNALIEYYVTVPSGDLLINDLVIYCNGEAITTVSPVDKSFTSIGGTILINETGDYVFTAVYTYYSFRGESGTLNSNQIIYSYQNASSQENGTGSDNASASITIWDINNPSLSTIITEGDYTADIAYTITKSGDGFSDESLDVIVNGVSIGSSTPNSSNRLGDLPFTEDNEWVLNVVYTATVNGKTVTAVSNNLTFITRNTSGGNSSVNETGNNTNESGETPEPQPGEMQVIIRDANYPNNAVITLNDKYNALIEYYVTVPSGDLLINDLVIYCNGEAITTVSPVDKSFTSIGGTILINETGDYVFTAVYTYYSFRGESGTFNSNQITYHVTINNQSQISEETLSVSVSDVFYPNEVTATVRSSVDGIYTVHIGQYSKDVTVSGGVGSVNFALPAGPYTAAVESKTNSSFRNSTTFNVLSIGKTTPQITINALINQNNVSITVNLPIDINNENVTVTLNNNNGREVTLTNGSAIVEYIDLEDGDYSYTVTYAGNDDYNGVSDTKTFTISNENPSQTQSLTVTVDDVIYPNEAVVTVKSSVDGVYIVSVNGTVKEVTVDGGIGTAAFALPSNDYTAEVVSKISSTFKNATSFKVLKANVAESEAVNIDVPSNSTSPTFTIDLPNATGTFTVTVDNNPISKLLVNGKASITLDNLTEANHTIVIHYSGDDNYSPITTTKIVIVNNTVIIIKNQTGSNTSSNPSTIVASDLTRAQNSPYDFKATFYNNNGELLQNATVNFIINGNDHMVKTDEYGVAKLVNVLSAGSYDIQIRNLATGETLNKSVKIVKRITGNKNINVDYTFTATYKIRVYADNGQVAGANEAVVITLNNVKHTAYTNSKGYVSFKISGLMPKTYKITVEYKGVKVSNNVVVKKLVLKAKNAKFKKAKKVKKYKVTLKTSSGKAVTGKKITLKVKGKTIKAKTNSKGVATFKIKNLKKVGKFKATITYQKLSIKKTIKIRR